MLAKSGENKLCDEGISLSDIPGSAEAFASRSSIPPLKTNNRSRLLIAERVGVGKISPLSECFIVKLNVQWWLGNDSKHGF